MDLIVGIQEASHRIELTKYWKHKEWLLFLVISSSILKDLLQSQRHHLVLERLQSDHRVQLNYSWPKAPLQLHLDFHSK